MRTSQAIAGMNQHDLFREVKTTINECSSDENLYADMYYRINVPWYLKSLTVSINRISISDILNIMLYIIDNFSAEKMC